MNSAVAERYSYLEWIGLPFAKKKRLRQKGGLTVMSNTYYYSVNGLARPIIAHCHDPEKRLRRHSPEK